MASLRVAALLLALCLGGSRAAHLEFTKGLAGWEHSADAKYTGKFELGTPEVLKTQALKVRGGRRDQVFLESCVAAVPPTAPRTSRKVAAADQ